MIFLLVPHTRLGDIKKNKLLKVYRGVGHGLRRAGHYRCKLHSSFNLPHSSSHMPCTLCMFVDCNTLEVEDLVLANGGTLFIWGAVGAVFIAANVVWYKQGNLN